MTHFSLNDLDQIIADRVGADSKTSYTKTLLDAGIAKTTKKFGEESVEAIIAVMQKDRSAITAESADVLYHLLVMLRSAHVPLHDVMAELEKRTVRSGIEEKNSRNG